MFCQMCFERQPCCIPHMWTAFEDIAVTYSTVQLHPFYCLCVLRMSTIMAVSLNPESRHYLLQLHSSPLSSHLFSSLIFPLLSAATLYWHVFCALVPSFSLALDNGSGGCFWFSFFSLSAFVLPFPWNQKNNFYLFRVQDMPSILCQAQNVDLSLRLYWSVKKLRHDWKQLSIWYILLLFEMPLKTENPSLMLESKLPSSSRHAIYTQSSYCSD